MKPTPAPAHPSADEQAALWAARLDGSTLAATDRAALEAWLAADPHHRTLLAAYCQFSADLEQRLPLLAGIRDEAAEIPTASKTTLLRPWLRRPLWVGAALTAAAAVAVVLWSGRPQDQLLDLATPAAQRAERTLADGTQVELNAHTTLAVAFSGTERRVRLAGGEAFFSVSKDPDRPFFVETPAGIVRVTGTHFNVRTDAADDLEVTVVEGSVQVHATGDTAPHALRPGGRLTRHGEKVGVASLSPRELDDALAWRTGQVVFSGTPLREALGRFARYHGRTLRATEAAAGQRVGGRYALNDLDGFLAALEEVLPVHVTHGADGSVAVDTVQP